MAKFLYITVQTYTPHIGYRPQVQKLFVEIDFLAESEDAVMRVVVFGVDLVVVVKREMEVLTEK